VLAGLLLAQPPTGSRHAERRRLLQDVLGEADLPHIAFSREVPGTDPEVFAAAEAMGLEGIVSKNVNSPYRSGTTLHG